MHHIIMCLRDPGLSDDYSNSWIFLWKFTNEVSPGVLARTQVSYGEKLQLVKVSCPSAFITSLYIIYRFTFIYVYNNTIICFNFSQWKMSVTKCFSCLRLPLMYIRFILKLLKSIQHWCKNMLEFWLVDNSSYLKTQIDELIYCI